MAADSTAVCNLALGIMGQDLIDSIDGTSVLEQKCNLFYNQELGELLEDGPKKGWKFANLTFHGVDDDIATVTSIVQNGTDITVAATHTLQVGDMTELDDDTGYPGTYDVKAVSGTATFDVTATFVATGTGTARWTSEAFFYRFLVPTGKDVLAVSVGGIELTDWKKEGLYILTNMESEEVDMAIVKSITTVTLFPDSFVKALALRIAVDLAYNITQDMNLVDRLTVASDDAKHKAIANDEHKKYVQESSETWVEVGNTMEVQ